MSSIANANTNPTVKGTAIVTGAAAGIGRAIALRLAVDGFDLGLFDLPASEHTLSTLANQIRDETGRRVVTVLGSVAIEEDVKRLVDTVAEQLGGIEVMVANAGVSTHRVLHETSTEEFDHIVNTNLRGTFFSYKHAAIQMIAQGRGGRIIGASSIAGKRGIPEQAVYSGTKFAIRGMTQCAAMNYGKYGITVNAYAPGAIRTPLLDGLDEDHTSRSGQPRGSWTQSLDGANLLGRIGEPEDIAGLVSFLASKDASFITGQTFTVDGGNCFD